MFPLLGDAQPLHFGMLPLVRNELIMIIYVHLYVF